ncbi:hypothetical protein VTN96DRAFT_496 [Rasamsonia emersonii]|uniref:Uncharacterized protein n=1 Tax=Rasamsonia emersonii (strain ATCC 16479 / CBS 393.64 / IMI 116815) TaxID=1408163 RepID=A0A0F4Z6M1_RASE3|nr:hypothetical protein T310_0214 [Rasamsonia emersonii CBS 393.64]KKA25736.1 hypothetical protein T310_0214 [Rasamsonia emersonii CBS 393.64]
MGHENFPVLRPQHQVASPQDPFDHQSSSVHASDPTAWESHGTMRPLQDQQSVSTVEQSINEIELGVSRKPLKLDSKKDPDQQQYIDETRTTSIASSPSNQLTAMEPISPLYATDFARPTTSPHIAKNSYRSPPSPGRVIYSASPRIHSPASSQIFERSVQEDILPVQASPSIPSHIMTDNHIPPILEASSAAITDDRLDPDSIEIITHAIHQPAAVTVTGTGAVNQSAASSWHEDVAAVPVRNEDSVSNYGALDSADIRRLSFISFADVVHAEHIENSDQFSSRDSLHNLALSTYPAALTAHNRSPSPMRSPVSSHRLSTSPPTSASLSSKGLETSLSRGRSRPGSPLSLPLHSPPSGASGSFHGELNIETMRQALRRTGSADMSAIRSVQLSAIGDDEAPDRAIK